MNELDREADEIEGKIMGIFFGGLAVIVFFVVVLRIGTWFH